MQAILRLLAAPLLDWRVSGVENVPRKGTLLVAINHTNWLDIVLPGLFFPRSVVGFAKAESFRSYPLAWLLKWMKFIPIRRGEVDRAALERAIRALHEGAAFIIAPEGTRTYDGRLIRAKSGVALLAAASHATILPMAVAGTNRGAFAKNVRSLRRTKVDIKIGQPMFLDTRHAGRNCRQEIADELMLYIAQLLPEEQRGYYANMTIEFPRYFRDASSDARPRAMQFAGAESRE